MKEIGYALVAPLPFFLINNNPKIPPEIYGLAERVAHRAAVNAVGKVMKTRIQGVMNNLSDSFLLSPVEVRELTKQYFKAVDKCIDDYKHWLNQFQKLPGQVTLLYKWRRCDQDGVIF